MKRPNPLAGTIAGYLAGLEAGDWTAAEITARALERCHTDGVAWRAIDVLDPDTPRRHPRRQIADSDDPIMADTPVDVISGKITWPIH